MFIGLLRDIWSQKGWLIAIVLFIACSIGIYSSFRSVYDSALGTIDRANERLHASDLIVYTVAGADRSSDFRNIVGVDSVTPMYATEIYTKPDGKRIRGQVSAVPADGVVDSYQLISGSNVAGPNDIVVEHHYADHHDIAIGDTITLYLDGNPKTFTVSGIYFSPNNLYMISPDGWIENDFGFFTIQAEAISDTVNEYHLTITDTTSIAEMQDRVKSLLDAEGIAGVVNRTDETLATTAFKEDASALNSLANIFTVILLLVSAVVFFIIMSRNVEQKRREIGVYRAMGFSRLFIFRYYISFSLIAVTLGFLLSLPFAHYLLSYIIDYWGSEVLQIPSSFLVYHLANVYVLEATVFSAVVIFIAAAIPAWRAASLGPAEAMKSYIVHSKGSRILYHSAVSVKKKLYLRDIFGHKFRSASMILGIALVLSMSLAFVLSMNSYIVSINNRFDQNEKWDLRVVFADTATEDAVRKIQEISGVKRVEPIVASVAELSFNNTSLGVQYNRLDRDTELVEFSLDSGSLDPSGIVVSSDVSYRLAADIGDIVSLSGREGKESVPIVGIFKEFGSSEIYRLDTPTNPSGALLTIDQQYEKSIDAALEKSGVVKSWVRKGVFAEGWLALFEEYQGMVVAMDAISVLLALLIVAIFAFLGITERRWEFVMLKLLGFSNKTIIIGSIVEYFFLSLFGVVLGTPIGMQLAAVFASTFQELMAAPPTVISWSPVLIRSVLLITVIVLTIWIIMMFDLRHRVVGKIRRLFGTV